MIVLAAGLGSRFRQSGGSTHKLDALLGGMTLLERVRRSVAAAGLGCHVVRATADAGGWILPGDLPLVSPNSLRQVAQALASHPVVQPFWNGQSGHPVGFGVECFAALTALCGDTGAASIVRAHRAAGAAQSLQLDDQGIVTDIDTLADLARAQALLDAAPA